MILPFSQAARKVPSYVMVMKLVFLVMHRGIQMLPDIFGMLTTINVRRSKVIKNLFRQFPICYNTNNTTRLALHYSWPMV